MRLIIIGCEYVGKSTLAGEIRTWLVHTMGSCNTSFHDHFVMPFSEGEGPAVDREVAQIMAMEPALLEKYTRYMIHYHISPGFFADNDHCMVNAYYADAIYAPLYYGYGRPGEYADRRVMARYYDAEIMEMAPDTVLVLMKASPDVIRRRMRERPHPRNILKEQDVEQVLARFEEEYTNSLIRRRFVLDTSDSSATETFQKFLQEIEPHLTDRDRLRIVSHQALRC